MQYSFCNLVIDIEDSPSIPTSNYDLFRKQGDNNPDIRYKCILDKQLDFPDKEPVFECMPGRKVYLISDCGYEYYYSMPDRLICRLIKEEKGYILYYRVIGDGLFTELNLINSLILENAMYEVGRYLLHSSYIKTKYGAVLFTAPSGTGKSTQADLWRKYRGAEIMNGDRTCVWKENDRWMAGGALWCGTSGIMKNEICELAAIVVLKQGPVNMITPLRMVSKIARMLEQTTINDWDKNMFESAREFWADLCSNVPVLELNCTPDERAVQVLEEELEKYDRKH